MIEDHYIAALSQYWSETFRLTKSVLGDMEFEVRASSEKEAVDRLTRASGGVLNAKLAPGITMRGGEVQLAVKPAEA